MLPALSLCRVIKTYRRHGVPALCELSLVVDRGTRLAVVGRSGSGKSTLLNLMGGLDTPTSGSVEFDGLPISTLSERQRSLLRRQRIGYVFQSYHLFPTLTCAENVAMPLHLQRCEPSLLRGRVERALDEVGLANRASHLPDELSGGERQRAAIARALVINPDLLLADEPTGNLDGDAAEQVAQLLFGTAEQRHATLVLVTHNERLAAGCDRIVRLTSGVLTEQNDSKVHETREHAAGDVA